MRTQAQYLAQQKIECEFNLAYACSQNFKLRFSISGLTKEEFEFRQAEDKLREQIRLQRQNSH